MIQLFKVFLIFLMIFINSYSLHSDADEPSPEDHWSKLEQLITFRTKMGELEKQLKMKKKNASLKKQWNEFEKKLIALENELYKKPLEINGYIIANENIDQKISEFLLTQVPGGCVHVPLPPPERMIHVKMVEGKTSDIFFQKQVIVNCKLQKGERVDSAFECEAESVRLRSAK